MFESLAIIASRYRSPAASGLGRLDGLDLPTMLGTGDRIAAAEQAIAVREDAPASRRVGEELDELLSVLSNRPVRRVVGCELGADVVRLPVLDVDLGAELVETAEEIVKWWAQTGNSGRRYIVGRLS